MRPSAPGWWLGTALLLAPVAAFAAHHERGEGEFTLLFVGGAAGDTTSPTLQRLQARLATLDAEHTLVVFTGNYAAGELPGEFEPGRATAEAAISAHVAATADFVKRGGRVSFLPGHRDFAEGGSRAVRRLRKFLNHSFQTLLEDPDAEEQRDLDVMPQAACGDPVLLELTGNLGVLLVNSQWWMQDWATDPQANEGCRVKTRAAFEVQLTDSLRAYRGRRLVIASHHPLHSYGAFGGSFTAAAHVTPAPVVGTAWVLAREVGLVEQHQNHPMVRSYLDLMFEQTQRNGAYVFASGHDASLQYLTLERQTQLIAGTSARAGEPTVGAGEGDFAAPTPGWVELVIDAAGEGEASFFSGLADDTVLFHHPLPALVMPGVMQLDPPGPFPEGTVSSTYTKEHVWQMGSVMKFLVGSFYSDAYALKLPYQTLNLETEQGGLTPRGIGGGLQTNSLKLRDPEGGDWAMRAVTKDSSRVLPWPQNQMTVLNRLLDHGYTATHPEAALAVPRLSEAVGVLHSEPRLLYLPDQEALGPYRGFIANEVVLLERRPKAPKEGVLPESMAGAPGEEGKTKFKSTEDTLDKVIDKPLKNRVDQEAMLRARLLDMFLGDWDRHSGQWAFAVTSGADGIKTYRPIARDRDQALANYDGLGLFLARIAAPGVRILQPFTADYASVKWLNYNARDIDPILLNQLSRERWLQIAREAQQALTNEVIDEALASWHPEAYALDGARIKAALQSRRDQLVDVAADYFALINHHADVLGSSHADTFELTFEEGGALHLTIHGKSKAGNDKAPFFDRVYLPAETSQLRLYALAGDDTLVLHGDGETSIDVRFVGGEGHDTVLAAQPTSAAPLSARAIRVYDTDDGLTIDPSVVVRDERSNRADLNEYDQLENHDPDFGTFAFFLFANADQGAYVGGRYAYTLQGYKKHPFGARHELGAATATASLGAIVDYKGVFPASVELLDQQVDLRVQTQTNTRNFFGLTNRVIPAGPDPDYFRVRQARYEGQYGLSYGFGGDRTRVGAQLLGQAIVTEATPDRFVTASHDVTPDAIGARFFAGGRLFADKNTFDDLVLPKRGIALHASAEGRYDVAHGNQFSITYTGVGAVAIPFDRERRFVLITRAGVEGIVGDHPFYFAPTLGGGNLRAYHFQQLAGDVAFFNSTDLRVDVIRIYSGLPSTIGLSLSADHGRVFGPTIATNEYHFDYGGGLWWSILDVVGVSLTYFRSLEGESRLSFSLGPLFSQTGF